MLNWDADIFICGFWFDEPHWDSTTTSFVLHIFILHEKRMFVITSTKYNIKYISYATIVEMGFRVKFQDNVRHMSNNT